MDGDGHGTRREVSPRGLRGGIPLNGSSFLVQKKYRGRGGSGALDLNVQGEEDCRETSTDSPESLSETQGGFRRRGTRRGAINYLDDD